MTRSRGSCGVLFRVLDPFNFYGFEVNIEHGFKRIIKMENGNMSVVKTLNDGGIAQNIWFKVQVEAVQSHFTVRFGEATKYSKYNEAPVVMEFEDVTHVFGQVGLHTNGNDDFYFTDLNIKPLICQNRWEICPHVNVFSNAASIYHEKWNLSYKAK